MKYPTKKFNIQSITIQIASGHEIRGWAERTLPTGKRVGEVRNADTVRFKTFKPLKDGLFCERIFGPVKDFVCSCGKNHKKAQHLFSSRQTTSTLNEKAYCPECEVDITVAKERRYRLGFIKLNSLVTHIWFFKNKPSNPLPDWFEINKKFFELVTYCALQFVTHDYLPTTLTELWLLKPSLREHFVGNQPENLSAYSARRQYWLSLQPFYRINEKLCLTIKPALRGEASPTDNSHLKHTRSNRLSIAIFSKQLVKKKPNVSTTNTWVSKHTQTFFFSSDEMKLLPAFLMRVFETDSLAPPSKHFDGFNESKPSSVFSNVCNLKIEQTLFSSFSSKNTIVLNCYKCRTTGLKQNLFCNHSGFVFPSTIKSWWKHRAMNTVFFQRKGLWFWNRKNKTFNSKLLFPQLCYLRFQVEGRRRRKERSSFLLSWSGFLFFDQHTPAKITSRIQTVTNSIRMELTIFNPVKNEVLRGGCFSSQKNKSPFQIEDGSKLCFERIFDLKQNSVFVSNRRFDKLRFEGLLGSAWGWFFFGLHKKAGGSFFQGCSRRSLLFQFFNDRDFNDRDFNDRDYHTKDGSKQSFEKIFDFFENYIFVSNLDFFQSFALNQLRFVSNHRFENRRFETKVLKKALKTVCKEKKLDSFPRCTQKTVFTELMQANLSSLLNLTLPVNQKPISVLTPTTSLLQEGVLKQNHVVTTQTSSLSRILKRGATIRNKPKVSTKQPRVLTKLPTVAAKRFVSSFQSKPFQFFDGSKLGFEKIFDLEENYIFVSNRRFEKRSFDIDWKQHFKRLRELKRGMLSPIPYYENLLREQLFQLVLLLTVPLLSLFNDQTHHHSLLPTIRNKLPIPNLRFSRRVEDPQKFKNRLPVRFNFDKKDASCFSQFNQKRSFENKGGLVKLKKTEPDSSHQYLSSNRRFFQSFASSNRRFDNQNCSSSKKVLKFCFLENKNLFFNKLKKQAIEFTARGKLLAFFWSPPSFLTQLPVGDHFFFFVTNHKILRYCNKLLQDQRVQGKEISRGPSAIEKDRFLTFLTINRYPVQTISLKNGLTIQIKDQLNSQKEKRERKIDRLNTRATNHHANSSKSLLLYPISSVAPKSEVRLPSPSLWRQKHHSTLPPLPPKKQPNLATTVTLHFFRKNKINEGTFSLNRFCFALQPEGLLTDSSTFFFLNKRQTRLMVWPKAPHRRIGRAERCILFCVPVRFTPVVSDVSTTLRTVKADPQYKTGDSIQSYSKQNFLAILKKHLLEETNSSQNRVSETEWIIRPTFFFNKFDPLLFSLLHRLIKKCWHAPHPQQLLDTSFRSRSTGPTALFQLVSSYFSFKGRHSSVHPLIALNRFQKKFLRIDKLLKTSTFLLKRYRIKQRRAIVRYRKARRSLKGFAQFPYVAQTKSPPHLLSSIFVSALPVLPPTLRPIVALPGGITAISDLNKLYQRILYRNIRLRKSPEADLAQRMLQEAVDALIENGRGEAKPFTDLQNRPYKSLSDILKGKEGRFRQNLLGKRVDYSGRSVIVVGPKLQIHQCGLPLQMAKELFQPFLLRTLQRSGLVANIIQAKRLIDLDEPIISKILQQLVPQYPILLNRAPTLHRLGIQAFQPKIISGQTILLHPLVCTAFNADFDGDQMAVHIPLSAKARSEAWNLMWSYKNLFSASTGQPNIVPTQDMVLGISYLTTVPSNGFSSKPFFEKNGAMFYNFREVINAYKRKLVHLQSSVWVQTNVGIETGLDGEDPSEVLIRWNGKLIERYFTFQYHSSTPRSMPIQYLLTTPGRVLMNQLIFAE
uniref:DNA-directed RNA polymerase subunit n=1 Tax=Xylochloris irregularis TaxID=480381 RepID=A0A097KMC2_9CHLO|nr:beta' subunit of RNA polymerase [Xylochloris irregularis]AIT94341.1 beta' subunit of RNA polymerase [Xylochloris irregularis]